jgi:transcription elongation factor GreA
MQVPHRKKETYRRPKLDPYLTQEKFTELTEKLNKLKTIKQPREAREVKRLAMMGDFSENVGYQLAKGRLRGLNQRILNIEEQVKYAQIIKKNNNKKIVRLGDLVSLKNDKIQKTYRLLGSTETNPSAGIISHNSPLGIALLGHQVGDLIKIKLKDNIISYKITKIE